MNPNPFSTRNVRIDPVITSCLSAPYRRSESPIAPTEGHRHHPVRPDPLAVPFSTSSVCDCESRSSGELGGARSHEIVIEASRIASGMGRHRSEQLLERRRDSRTRSAARGDAKGATACRVTRQARFIAFNTLGHAADWRNSGSIGRMTTMRSAWSRGRGPCRGAPSRYSITR